VFPSLPSRARSFGPTAINQNLAFLVMLLKQSPQVGRVFLLNGGDLDHMPEAMGLGSLDVPLVRPGDVTFELDVVIEMGAQLPLEWLRHVRALGVKIITSLSATPMPTMPKRRCSRAPAARFSTARHGTKYGRCRIT